MARVMLCYGGFKGPSSTKAGIDLVPSLSPPSYHSEALMKNIPMMSSVSYTTDRRLNRVQLANLRRKAEAGLACLFERNRHIRGRLHDISREATTFHTTTIEYPKRDTCDIQATHDNRRQSSRMRPASFQILSFNEIFRARASIALIIDCTYIRSRARIHWEPISLLSLLPSKSCLWQSLYGQSI